MGHLSRCINIAIYLKKKNYNISFLVRNHYGANYSSIPQGFSITCLPSTISEKKTFKDYNQWLGCPIEEEISKVKKFILSKKIDMLIIDHYSYNETLISPLREFTKITMIDDLALKSYSCDILINQNLSAEKNIYKELILNSDCRFLLGPTYALIDEAFSEIRPKKPVKLKKVREIGVFFGGSDLTNETIKVVRSFIKLSDKDLKLNIILSESHDTFAKIKSLINQGGLLNQIKLNSYISKMPEFIMSNDIFFGASGVSTWERCSLGKAAFVVSVVDNQKAISKSAQEKGVIYLLGDGKVTNIDDWTKVFGMLKNVDQLNKISSNGFRIVDGKGVKRLTEVFLEKLDINN